MNTKKTSRSTGQIRSTFVILITAFLLLAGHSQAAAQADSLTSASGYFDWLLGRGASSALVSPNSVLHTPEGLFRGQDGANTFVDQLRGSFSNLEFDVQSSAIAGDSLVIEFQMSGVHTGSYQGMDWDCATVSAPGVAVLKTGEDGISEQWITYDQQTLLDQMYVHSLVPWTERPTCDAYLGVEQPLADPIAVPEGPPSCLTPVICRTAF